MCKAELKQPSEHSENMIQKKIDQLIDFFLSVSQRNILSIKMGRS
jgi:hypothetical protein